MTCGWGGERKGEEGGGGGGREMEGREMKDQLWQPLTRKGVRRIFIIIYITININYILLYKNKII